MAELAAIGVPWSVAAGLLLLHLHSCSLLLLGLLLLAFVIFKAGGVFSKQLQGGWAGQEQEHTVSDQWRY
jgi:hypothetical protein